MRGMANNQSKNMVSQILFILLALVASQSFVACQTKGQKATAAIQKCQQLLDKDDVLAAGNCYGDAIVANPDSATEISKTGEDAVYKKCVELHDKQNYKQAIICFDATTALKPDSAKVYFLLADSYYQYNKVSDNGTTDLLDRAEEAVKRGLQIRPESASAHGLYGEILDVKTNYRQATEEYRQAIKLDPKISDYWTMLALTQEKLSNLNEAATSYKSALVVNSKDTTALYFLGVLYEKMGKLDEAIETLEKQQNLETLDDETEQRLKALKDKRLKAIEDSRIIEKQSKSKTGLSASGKP